MTTEQATPGTIPANRAQRWTTVVNGHRARQLRHQRGLSRDELAAKAGLSPAAIARLERGEATSCRTRTLARLAAALGEHPTAIAIQSQTPTVQHHVIGRLMCDAAPAL